jgi:hypothetical protein
MRGNNQQAVGAIPISMYHDKSPGILGWTATHAHRSSRIMDPAGFAKSSGLGLDCQIQAEQMACYRQLADHTE